MVVKCCNKEIAVFEVKFYPIESLDDFEDELSLPVKFCPFCGTFLNDQVEQTWR